MIKRALLFSTLCLTIFFGMSLETTYAKKTAGDARGFLKASSVGTGLKETDPIEISGIVITAAFGLVGIIFLILMIYGGFTWMLARGNEELVTKARNTVKQAAIGLVIVAAAYSITFMITGLFQRGAQAGSNTNSQLNAGFGDRVP